MSKTEEKTTVTVGLSWFSSDPVFPEVLEAMEQELRRGKFLAKEAIESLQELRPLNGGQPFTGQTHYGPHTYINIETPSLGKAVFIARVMEDFLWHEFSEKSPFFFGKYDTGGLCISFAHKSLPALLDSLEIALREAQQDVKGTRRFFPSKKLQSLRTTLRQIYS